MGVSKAFPQGNRLWVKVRAPGQKGRNVPLGLTVDADPADVEYARLTIARAVKAGTWTPPAKKVIPATLDEFLVEYERHYKAKAGPDLRKSRENSWNRDGPQFRAMLDTLEERGALTLKAVTTAHVERYRDLRMAAGRSVATVRKDIRLGRAAWGWAIRMGYADPPNPFEGVTFPNEEKKDPRNLSQFELLKVMPWLQEHAMPEAFAAAAIALYSGLRLDEIMTLDQTQLSWVEPGSIRVLRSKGRKPRSTIFPAELRAILEPYKAAAGPVLPGADRERIQRQIQLCARRTGVEFSIHDLRRTFASILAAKGVPTTVIRDYLGHASVATTEGYYLARNTDVRAQDSVSLGRSWVERDPNTENDASTAAS